MNETQRQAYLQAMGIQCYYPRAVLPGAKPSPNYEFDAEPMSAVDHSIGTKSLKIGAIGSGPARASLGRTSSGKKNSPGNSAVDKQSVHIEQPESKAARGLGTVSPNQSGRTNTDESRSATVESKPVVLPTPVPETEESSQWPDDELQFRLHYYRINDTLSVIDEVPHQQAGGDSAKTITLLKAILRALKVEHEACDFRADVFSWPLASGISMKNEPAVEAKKALRGFIEMRQQTDRFSNLLVFAAQVDDMLAAEGDSSARDFEVSNNAYHISITHSLQAMLAYPLLKRDVWMHLQALLGRLQTALKTSK